MSGASCGCCCPNRRKWFDFGGTLGKPQGEAKIAEVFQSYLSKRIQDATQALSSANDYSQVRAAVNLKQSWLMLQSNRRKYKAVDLGSLGDTVESLETRNGVLLQDADQQVRQRRPTTRRGDRQPRAAEQLLLPAGRAAVEERRLGPGQQFRRPAGRSRREGEGRVVQFRVA